MVPNDPSCKTTLGPIDCNTNPNDPSCGRQPPVDCKTNPDDPSCTTPPLRMSTKIPHVHHVSPPMGRNFFQEALSTQYRRFAEFPYREELEPLYEYIQKFWKKSISDLENSDFDLEECFSLVDLQLKEAADNNDIEKWQELMNLKYLLRSFLVEVLFEFGNDLQGYLEYPSDPKEIDHLVNCEAFKRLGCILYNEKPIIITFNYDDFIERAIEYASKIKQDDYTTTNKFEDQVLDHELGYSYWNWNRALGYGIKFDEVMLYDRSKGTKQKHFEGSKFYSHPENTLYQWHLLKLHGSSNWFQYLPYTPNFYLNEDKEELSKRVLERHGKIILSERDRIFLHAPTLHDLYIEPIIITPIIHKEKHFDDPLYSKLLKPIWDKAKDSLTNCKRLIVIGYSFPPTDFLTKKMFLESFSRNTLNELIIVSPSQETINKVKDLCHFKEPKTFRNLEEYIEYYDNNV